jgi:Asp-tRNA(Asn)/Glu-tRNA(Gln) amidotransferase A subunit family amidase
MMRKFIIILCWMGVGIAGWGQGTVSEGTPGASAAGGKEASTAGERDPGGGKRPADVGSAQKTFDVVETSIADIHRALREKTCTCEFLVNEYLRRIAAYDQPTGLNSIIVVNPDAVKTARMLDSVYARTGQMRPLHCIPLIVKDNYNTKGLQTTAGSLALKGFAPATDATMVRKLKDAGAIVLAKSNMAEWAFSAMVTISSIAGETHNPYNLAHTTAGSSGGTAAAVAASLGEAGVGTDTGNSIRGPSSHNALVGFRATIGLISREGIAPLYLRNDMGGPMARSVEDATRMLEVLAGYDPADPITRYSAGKIPANYTQFLDKNGLKGARIGVLRALSDKADADPQVHALFEQAILDLKKAGAVIVDPIEVVGFDSLGEGQWCSVFRQDVDRYLASLGPGAPVHSLQDVADSKKYSDYIKDDLLSELNKGVLTDTVTHSCDDAYSDPRRIAYRNAVVAAMDRAHVGAIIYPSWNSPPAKIGDFAGYKGDNSQIIAPHTGLPAFTVPMGFTYDDLPAGLQFLGRAFDEPTLIRYTYGYEQATHHRRPPPGYPALKGE